MRSRAGASGSISTDISITSSEINLKTSKYILEETHIEL
jgi:hypothetical protein